MHARYISRVKPGRACRPTTRSRRAGSIGYLVRGTLPHIFPWRFPWPDWVAGASDTARRSWPHGCWRSRSSPGSACAAGTSFNSNNSLPGTDSQAAATLLTQNFPAASGEGDQVVIQAEHGATIKSAPVQSAMTWRWPRSPRCRASKRRTARTPVTGRRRSAGTARWPSPRDWDKAATQVTKPTPRTSSARRNPPDGPDVHISLSGQSIADLGTPEHRVSVVVGLLAALVIMLIVFGGALLSSLCPWWRRSWRW